MSHSPDTAENTLIKDERLLHDLIREAGDIAMSYYGHNPEEWKKEDTSPVSEADLAVDKFIIENITRARPDYAYLSEESADDLSRMSASKVWVIDPIDGTRAFLNGRPHWTISMALLEHNKPVLATVYNPVSNEFFHARKNGGAFLGDKKVRVSNMQEIKDSRLLINKHVFKKADWPGPWPDFHEQSRCSMAYRLALVAAGIFDGAIALSRKSDWDLAASDLLVREAGGRISNHAGEDIIYNQRSTRHPSTVCAGPLLHDKLLKLTRPLTLP